jgi:hypothetical protein
LHQEGVGEAIFLQNKAAVLPVTVAMRLPGRSSGPPMPVVSCFNVSDAVTAAVNWAIKMMLGTTQNTASRRLVTAHVQQGASGCH